MTDSPMDSNEMPGLVAEIAPGEREHAWRPERFLVIVAHPDDADFGPAATAARWIDAGSIGRLVCCTSGDAGGEDPDMDPVELARVREREQRDAAQVVGYEDVVFLHQPDGALANDLAVREMLVREIRAFRPDAVLCTDPEVLFHDDSGVNHSDHRAAGMAAVDAVYPAARNPMAFPHLERAGLRSHKVKRLYLFWSERPNAWFDVTTTIDRKIEALHAHASQISEPDRLDERVRERAAEVGARIGARAGDALRAIVIEEDEEEVAADTGVATAEAEMEAEVELGADAGSG